MSLTHRLDRQVLAYAEMQSLQEADRKKRQSENSLKGENNRLIKAIRARLARDQDARIIIEGEGGIGKSTLALGLGEILNPELYVNDIQTAVDKAISFSSLQFMDSTSLPNRTVLDFDEPGQGWYHRQFMSQASQILAQTFIGNRFQQFITILTVPNVTFLDADAVRLAHFLIRVKGQGYAKVHRILQPDFGGKEPYWPTLIDNMRFGKPDIKLWHLYEKKKFAFQTALYEKFRKELQAGEAPHMGNAEIAEMIIAKPQEFMREDGEKIDYAKIQDVFGIGLNRAYTIRSTVARKMNEKAKATP